MGNTTALNDWLANNGGASFDACSGVTPSNDFVALSDDWCDRISYGDFHRD